MYFYAAFTQNVSLVGINDMTLLLIDVMKFDYSKSNYEDEVDGAF